MALHTSTAIPTMRKILANMCSSCYRTRVRMSRTERNELWSRFPAGDHELEHRRGRRGRDVDVRDDGDPQTTRGPFRGPSDPAKGPPDYGFFLIFTHVPLAFFLKPFLQVVGFVGLVVGLVGLVTVPPGLPTLNVFDVSKVVRAGFVAAVSETANW